MRGWHYIGIDLEQDDDAAAWLGVHWLVDAWDWDVLDHWFAVWS